MSRTYVSQMLRVEAQTFFKSRCAYCQSPQALMNVTFEVDHILPEKESGPTVSANLAFTCPLCNGYKAARTRGRDPLTGRYAALFHPRRQKWARHFQWAADQQTIEGRTRAGRATIDALRLNNFNLLRLRTIWLAIGSSPPDWQSPQHVRL